MPGNADLDLVKRIERLAPGMPVILVTGYPTLPTAVRAVALPVVAYFVKPVGFDELIAPAERAITNYRAVQAVTAARDRLGRWREELTALEASLAAAGRGTTAATIAGFIDTSLRNVVGTMRDVRNLTDALTESAPDGTACQLLNCPRHDRLLRAVEDAVVVLESTRNAFKSKQLGDLRRRLEQVLREERAPQVD